MTINQLYDQIYSDKSTKEPDKFLGIYEPNKNLVDATLINNDKELHNKVMRLTADYAHHLTMRENYKKALPNLNKAIELFQTYPDFKDTDLFKLGFYETLLFDRAVANYYLKNLNEAKNDLKSLNTQFPENDKYKTWLSATQVYSMDNVVKTMTIIMASSVISTALFDRQDIGVFYDIILYIGAVSIIIIVTLQIIKRIRK
ncbi:MAG: tetratricopeptide (TPR) repeat protein [Vicingaceae bacterium]|jgi:tetratricopeptide (TPR) repeat protein